MPCGRVGGGGVGWGGVRPGQNFPFQPQAGDSQSSCPQWAPCAASVRHASQASLLCACASGVKMFDSESLIVG